MNRSDIERLLVEALRVTKHHDFVIIGSLSVLGAVERPPDAMTGSIDVDLYPKADPGRASEVASALGFGSPFERQYGYYADAVSPMLPTLPERWQARLVEVAFASGVGGFSIPMMLQSPNMCADRRATARGFAQVWRRVFCRWQTSNTGCAKR